MFKILSSLTFAAHSLRCHGAPNVRTNQRRRQIFDLIRRMQCCYFIYLFLHSPSLFLLTAHCALLDPGEYHCSLMFTKAHIAGGTLANLVYVMFETLQSKRTLVLLGHTEERTETTDTSEQVVTRSVVITGFASPHPPLGNGRDLATERPIGRAVLRRRCPHKPTYGEWCYLREGTDGDSASHDPMVLLLITETISETGSAKIMYSVFQQTQPREALPAEAIELEIDNAVDSVAPLAALGDAALRYPLLHGLSNSRDDEHGTEACQTDARTTETTPAVIYFRSAVAELQSALQEQEQLIKRIQQLREQLRNRDQVGRNGA